MMTTFMIKAALSRFGVAVQSIKFDVDNERIVVNFSMRGASQEKIIPFADIEELFADGSEARTYPVAGNITSGHTTGSGSGAWQQPGQT